MEEEVKKASRLDIDLYASLALQRASIKKSLEQLRPGIEALGEGSHAGHLHSLRIVKVPTSTLSVSIAKSLLTPADIALATINKEELRVTVEH